MQSYGKSKLRSGEIVKTDKGGKGRAKLEKVVSQTTTSGQNTVATKKKKKKENQSLVYLPTNTSL